MDAREQWQTLQGLLAKARSLAEAGDRAGALAEIERALELDPNFLAAHSLKEHLATAGDVGAAPPPAADPSAPAADIAVTELTAIEARVLARRAERRLATASEAIRRRDFAVAAAALDEARELGADPGQLLRAERALAEARRAPKRRVVTAGRVIAAAALFAGVVAVRYVDSRFMALKVPEPAPTASAAPRETSGTTGIATPTNEIIKLQPTTPRTPESTSPAPLPRVNSSERAASVPIASANTPSETMPTRPAPPALALAAPLGPIAPPAPVEPPARSAPVESPVRTAPPPESSVRNTPSTPPESAAANIPSTLRPVVQPPRPIDEEVGVREALQRYRAAYDQLNARSARAVWPAVDERALARAFDNLSSQQLQFDACDVSVRGAAATATCRGTATYTPKIGSGDAQVEPRRWEFTLRKDAGQWAIATARVER